MDFIGNNTVSLIDSDHKELFLNPVLIDNKIASKKNIDYVFKADSSTQVCLHIVSIIDLDKKNDQNKLNTIDGVYINGFPISADKNNSYIISSKSESIKNIDKYFHIYVTKLGNYMINYQWQIFNPDEKNSAFTKSGIYYNGVIFISKDPINNNTNLFNGNASALTDTNSSFQLMRTDPKLSGNIKLVIDSSQNLFLDTFKVSDNLNKQAHRHFSVSCNSNLMTDIRNCFASLDSKDLYKVPDDDMKAHEPFTEYEKQFDTVYSYGAETNDDELYNENFKILAPLWLNRVIPDFFIIFKVDGPFNTDTYKNIQDDKVLFNDFLKNGKLIKAFDMRQSAPLGKYIRNHYERTKQYPGSVMLQFKEQEDNNDYINGINSWFGISVDSGLFIKTDEISYFMNETVKKRSQEKLNQFIIDGFERNRLLCANLLNLEFMFNDDAENNYSMNRYFGLYLKENDFISYDYIEQVIDSKTKNQVITKYDNMHKPVDDSVISSVSDSLLKNSNYDNRIFLGIGPTDVIRIKEYNDLHGFLKNQIINMPYKNIDTCKVKQVPNAYKNFISMRFKRQIHYGEHFRIVIPDFNQEGIEAPVIFEIIASNDKRLQNAEGMISPFISVTNSKDDTDDFVYYRERSEESQQNIPFNQNHYFSGIIENNVRQTFSDFSVINVVKYYKIKGQQKSAIGKTRHIIQNKFDNNLDSISDSSIVNTEYPYVFRLAFYTQDLNNPEQLASLDEQLDRLYECIYQFSRYYNINIFPASKTEDKLSIMTDYTGAYFQHITDDILNNDYISIKSKLINAQINHKYYNELTKKYTDSSLYIYNFKYTDTKDSSLYIKDQTIEYFGNDDLNIKLYPLCNETKKYIGNNTVFAPVNFELLGWRKTSIVKLLDITDSMYEISIDDVTKLIPNTIINTVSGFKRLIDFDVTSVGIYVKPILFETNTYPADLGQYDLKNINLTYINDPSIKVSKLLSRMMAHGSSNKIDITTINNYNIENKFIKVSAGSVVNAVMSPYDLNKFIIKAADNAIVDSQYNLSLFSAMPVKVALMGIMPVKDIDMRINYSEKTHIDNEVYMTVPAGNSISINESKNEYNLNKNTIYTLISGHLNGLAINPGTQFIIIKDYIIFKYSIDDPKVSKNDRSISFAEIKDNIYADSDVIIKTQNSKIISNYDIETPEMIEKYFYKNDEYSNDLQYSLITPTVCTWKGTGMYYDNDSLFSIYNILQPDIKHINKGYFFEKHSYAGNSAGNSYLNYSLESLISTNDPSINNFRDYLLYSNITDTINLFLSENNRPLYTIGYYNKYINTLDFTIYGIKFSISLNANDFVKEIELSNYNKYEICIFNDYTVEKNEMIINTLENTILIINHNFNFNKFDPNNTIFYINENGKFTINDKYFWIKGKHHLLIDEAEADTKSIYIPVELNGSSLNKIIDCSCFFQFNSAKQDNYFHKGTENYIFSLPDISFDDTLPYIEIPADSKVQQSDLISSGKLSGYSVNSDYLNIPNNDIDSYQSYLINPAYKPEEDFMNTDNVMTDAQRYNMMINNYIASMDDANFKIYIKKKNASGIAVNVIETNSSYRPMRISATVPKNIKYNIDFYNPNFVDIITFNLNEDTDLIEKTKLNFTLANTSFNSINTLKNYYGYKVFDNINHDLSGSENAIFMKPEQSIMSSNWDRNFYRNYSDADNFKFIDGYVPGVEDKSFFGSKCIKLHNINILIKDWDKSEVSVKENSVSDYSPELRGKTTGNTAELTFNLTQMFYNKFITFENDTFKNNWILFNYNSNAINNYIKKTLIRFFKINNKNNFKLYSKAQDNNEIFLKSEPLDMSVFEEVKNFSSEYLMVNDEIILKVYLTDMTKTYYATYEFKSNN